jgi:radical SAM superfamily enzyme YgiQ (UPF0313 family)
MLQTNADVIALSPSVHGMRTIGCYRIATELRKQGYTCQVLDHFNFFTKSEVKIILDRCIGPDTKILAVSSTFAPGHGQPGDLDNDRRFNSFSYAVTYVKANYTHVKIVVGGQKASSYNHPDFDAQVVGLADLVLPEYLKFLKGKNPFFQYTLNPGGPIIIQGDAINSRFDFKHSQVVYNASDFVRPGESLPVELSRGCIFRCSFCNYQLNGKKNNDYIKDMAAFKEELLRNYYDHGVTRYIIMDDTHNDNLFKLEQLANVAQQLPFKFEYAAYLRIDLVRSHPETYSLLKDSGLAGAFFGIESLNWKSAKTIGKGLHPDKVVEELHKFRETLPHVSTAGGFIVGLPYDTPESLDNWTSRVVDHSFPLDSVHFFPLVVHPARTMYASEFEKDFDKWFTMTPNGWHNGIYDSKWAIDYANKLKQNLQATNRDKVGGFFNIIVPSLAIGGNEVDSKYNMLELKPMIRNVVDGYKHLLFN